MIRTNMHSNVKRTGSPALTPSCSVHILLMVWTWADTTSCMYFNPFSGSLVSPVTPSPGKNRCHAAASQISDRGIDRSHTPVFICFPLFWKLQQLKSLAVSNLLSIPLSVSFVAYPLFLYQVFVPFLLGSSYLKGIVTVHCHSSPPPSKFLHHSFSRLL